MVPEWYRRFDEQYRSLGLVPRFLVLFVSISVASAIGRMLPYDGPYRLGVQVGVVTVVVLVVLVALVAVIAAVRGGVGRDGDDRRIQDDRL
jgi:low affinity Fe/Cu permease